MKSPRLILIPVLFALASVVAVPISASAVVHTPAAAHIRGRAASPIPLQASGCSGDACIWLGTPSNGLVTIHGCAWKTPFYGHIQLSGPSGTGLPANSSTKIWASTSHYCAPGSGDQYFSKTVSAVAGQYCSTSWNGGSYDGTACETV